jgi:hypothetical protein
MARVLRARVKMGRLTLDEPTDLPEGTEVELVVASRVGTPAGGTHEGAEAADERFLCSSAAPEEEPPGSGGPDAIIEQVQRQTRG